MDPLSITASIAGLLGISGKIYSILSEFVSNVKDAPRSVQTAMFAVEEMRLALISVEKLILDVPSVPRKRKALVEVDHLVITLTESVITFSDLEALVSPFVTDSVIDTSAWKRLKWAWKEEKVSLSIQRLESHKSSIIMMLSILQCESDEEAQASQDTLQSMIEQVLQQNQYMLSRIEQLENACGVASHSSIPIQDAQSAIRDPQVSRVAVHSVPRMNSVSLEEGLHYTITKHEFEKILENTRVYRRAEINETDASFTTSSTRTHAWSAFSGLSLADISDISVIALPVFCEDLIRPWYPSEPQSGWWSGKKSFLNARFGQPITLYKLVVLGDVSGGKIELTNQFIWGFPTPTVEDSNRRGAIVEGQFCVIEILHTAGQEEYNASLDRIRDGEGFVLVYSITNRVSFLHVQRFHRRIQSIKAEKSGIDYPVIIAGNNSERVSEREVSTEEGQGLARVLGCNFIECSFRNYTNVDETFFDVVKELQHLGSNKSGDSFTTVKAHGPLAFDQEIVHSKGCVQESGGTPF